MAAAAGANVVRNESLSGITPVAWYPPTEISFEQWARQGRKLGVMGRNAGWWIGDWLAYGNSAYGERYARAARITGYDAQTLMNMVYVASHVAPSRRREKLSWSHHAEVVALSEQEQDYWLTRAEREHFSVRELRQAIHVERRRANGTAKRRMLGSRAAGADHQHADDGHDHEVVCPYCGRNFLAAEPHGTELTAARH